MRPNQNRRMRGRNRPKGPNPLTRSYESNGPDVKIRGTAQHIADKYAQLARDAQAAGDPVAAENYFQHGEHYFRIISGAQDQGRPANGGGYASRSYDDEIDEGDDEGQGPPQNGNAYNGYDDHGDPGQQPQPYEMRPDLNQGRDRFPSQNQRRDQRRFDGNGRQDYVRPDPQRQDYQRPDFPRQDLPRQDLPRQDRQQESRQDYGRQEYRQEPRQEGRQESRGDPSRYDNGRTEGRPEGRQEVRQENRQESRPERRPDARSEAPREPAPAAPAPRRERRREAVAAVAEDPGGLPAFLIAPARAVVAPAPVEPVEPAPAPEPAAEAIPVAKPRRRRRPRFEGTAVEEGAARAPAEDAPSD